VASFNECEQRGAAAAARRIGERFRVAVAVNACRPP
jgi:hypothetical protein